MNWRARAACLNADPNMFFPTVGGTEVPHALKVCATCPVTTECLTEALQRHPSHDYGVWGGTTVPQRTQMRKQQNDRPKAGLPARSRP